ncbi:hypothetical protein [Streptomyces sp. NPDC058664]|uniref:hypothetical protein n=1 Tax=unclassified Streptomyces TaxID=2593676 RepID=UPI00365EE97D
MSSTAAGNGTGAVDTAVAIIDTGIDDRHRDDAAAQPASYGFAGDPHAPVTGRFHGHLVHAGSY